MFTGGQPVWNFIPLYDDDIVNKRKWQLWQRPIPGAPLLPMGRWATRNDVPLQGLWDRPYVGRWSPATWNSAVLGKAQAAVVRHMAAAVGHLVTAVGWMAGIGERNEAGHDGVRACSTEASEPSQFQHRAYVSEWCRLVAN